MRRATAILALALAAAAAFTACRKSAPVAPLPSPAPKVVAVQPPARTSGYAFDGQIWALFDRALDPRSVDTTTVFLKKDTQRLAAAVSYEPTSRRIVVVPRATLALNTTYTVLLTERVRAKDGTPLAADYLWQFSTSSIRRLTYLTPSPSEVATPVAMLSWRSPDAVPGTLQFDVYAGTDSLAVLGRTLPAIARTTSAWHLPRAYWPSNTRVYWSVRTLNTTTGEQLESPVAGFTVGSLDAPSRAVTLPMLEWGGIRAGNALQYCTQTTVPMGVGTIAAVRFDLNPATLGRKVKSARLVMYATSNFSGIPFLSAWTATPASWPVCGMVYPGPPYPETGGQLATARVGSVSNQMILESIALAAWAEGMLRGGDFSGVLLTSTSSVLMSLNTGGGTQPRPVLELTLYD